MAGTVLVNLGDLLQRWTADRLLSTVRHTAVAMNVVALRWLKILTVIVLSADIKLKFINVLVWFVVSG